jgi:isocitrate/isopropylmalate dehydrogenase
MMLDFLGWTAESAALDESVKSALRENFVTPDLGGSKKTTEVGDWLARFVSDEGKMSTRRQ